MSEKNIDIRNYKNNSLKFAFSLWGGAPWEILVVKLIFWYYLRQLALKLSIWIFTRPPENLLVGYPFATIFSNLTLSVNNIFTRWAPWEILVVKLIFWYYVRQLALKLYIWIFIRPRENLVVGYPVATIFSKLTLSVNNIFTRWAPWEIIVI